MCNFGSTMCVMRCTFIFTRIKINRLEMFKKLFSQKTRKIIIYMKEKRFPSVYTCKTDKNVIILLIVNDVLVIFFANKL